MRWVRRFGAGWMLMAALGAGPAYADGGVPAAGQGAASQEAKAAAQALFDEAMALRKKDQLDEACAKLDESARLDPAPGAKFYLAECMERTGKLASAWLLYTEVADVMAATGQSKREAYARERVAALTPRLSRLSVTVPASRRIAGMVVRRDGVVVGEAQWGFAVPLDTGAHTIEATAPGMKPFKRTVELRAPGTVDVELPAWSADSGGALAGGALGGDEGAGLVAEPPSSSLRVAGLGVAGLGVAGVVAGAALGGLAMSKRDESNRGPCDPATDVCTPAGIALRADAITAATGSTIAFVAGGVLVAAGAALVVWPLVSGPAPTQATSRPAIRAAVAVRPGFVTLEGRW